MKRLLTLAIETSCDETSVAIIRNGREIFANLISSQIDIHRVFGGVVPEVASRKHLESINNMIHEALQEARISFKDLDLVGVTIGPGLIGALLVGISAAKAIAYSLKIPLVGVNHMEGHICANYISHPELAPPFIGLIVSGGHTYLVHVKDYVSMDIIGKTRDDAVGESFDKVARSLDLPYPGGPEIDLLSKSGNREAVIFPRVIIDKYTYDFSFSGLKTAVINYQHTLKQKNLPIPKADISASFQEAVMDVLVEKSLRLLQEKKLNKLVVSGGVAANSRLRQRLKEAAELNCLQLYFPSMVLCTDNAAMIGSAAYYRFINGYQSDLNLKVYPNLDFAQYQLLVDEPLRK